MDVATILANIKSQALVGNTGAADDNDRLMRYLNKAYSAIYADISQINPALFQKRQPVTVTAGVGTFSQPTFEVLSVIDIENGDFPLIERSTDDIERSDPSVSRSGNPASYEQTFTGLTTYPINSTTLNVRYLPTPPALTVDSLEADILVPPLFHEALEWATLWTLAYDERDKLVGSELQFTKSSYDGHMAALRQYVFSTLPKDKRRVRPVM